jgi:hypothetical protein
VRTLREQLAIQMIKRLKPVICSACGERGIVTRYDTDRGYLIDHPTRRFPCRALNVEEVRR